MLVVDDARINVELLKEVLTRDGHTVLTAADGLEALAIVQRDHPEVHVALFIWDTQTVSEKVAQRELELGVVGALRRNRSLEFEPLVRDEIVLAVPPAA